MKEYSYITLMEKPEIKDAAAMWFHSKWGVPKEAYLECMDAYLNKETKNGWYLCLDGEKIVGLISLRSGNHISLLFVDEAYHRRGIGTALVKYLQEYMLQNTKHTKVTVFASPYGIPFYHKVGFKDIGQETRKDGIIFTPMEFFL